jgi:hypothetical protein
MVLKGSESAEMAISADGIHLAQMIVACGQRTVAGWQKSKFEPAERF